MYRRSCGRTTERIDASRRPRIDVCGGEAHRWLAHNSSSPPVLPESQAVRRGVPPSILGIPSDMSKDGLCRPSADRKKGNMTLTVWTGWTTSWAALPAAAAESRIFCSSLKLQIQKAH